MPLLRRRSNATSPPVRGTEVMTPLGAMRRVARQMLVVLPLYTLAILLGTAGSIGIAELTYRARGRPNNWPSRQGSMQSMQGFHYLLARTGGPGLGFETLPMGMARTDFEAHARIRGWVTRGTGLMVHTQEGSTTQVHYRVDARDRVIGVVVHLPSVALRDAIGVETRLRMSWGMADGSVGQLDPTIVVHGLSVWRRPEAIWLIEMTPIAGDLYQVRIEGRYAGDPLFADRRETGGLSPADPRLAELKKSMALPPAARANVPAMGPTPFIMNAPVQRRRP